MMNDEVGVTPVKKTRKKKVSLVDKLVSETTKVNTSSANPVDGAEVMIVMKNGEVVNRINPNALPLFVKEHGLDMSAVQRIINRTYVNHEGYTFKVGV